jgi:hypothetical protein
MKSLAGAVAVTLALSCPTAQAGPHDRQDGKSEDVATALTVAGIVVPAALFANGFRPGVEAGDGQFMLGIVGMIGMIPGPAAGHWYTGHVGTYGMLARFGGYVFMIAGASMIEEANRCARGEQVSDGCEGADRNVGRVMVGAGIFAVAGSWAYDILEVRRQARASRVQIVPVIAPGSAGLVLGGSF